MSDVVGRIERREFVSDQELFDYIVGKVIAQGEPSTLGGICRYRAPNGHKCAVGHIIPNSIYRQDMEGGDLDEIVQCELGLTSYHLLRDLQLAHDGAGDNEHFVTDFTNRAKNVALTYGLKFNHGGEQ